MADASAAGEWGHLVIDGDTWIYTWESSDAKKTVHWRNTNHFSGKEKIHLKCKIPKMERIGKLKWPAMKNTNTSQCWLVDLNLKGAGRNGVGFRFYRAGNSQLYHHAKNIPSGL
jgi:hypothetical protein